MNYAVWLAWTARPRSDDADEEQAVPQTEEHPLGEYDAGLLRRLTGLLRETLLAELSVPAEQAAEITTRTRWTISQEAGTPWLNISDDKGSFRIGASGNWQDEPDGLVLYVRQAAYELTGRVDEFTSCSAAAAARGRRLARAPLTCPTCRSRSRLAVENLHVPGTTC